MAFRPRTPSTEPPPIASVPPIAAHPRYEALAGQLNLLHHGLQERQDRLELYAIEAELRDEATTPAIGGRQWRLRERKALLLERAPDPKSAAEAAPTGGLDPVVAHGLKLAAGEAVPPPRDRTAHIVALRSESEAIESAQRLVHIEFDEMRSELSHEIARTLLPQHRAILRSKYDAAMALAAAVTAERELTATMVGGGYCMLPDVLTSPRLDPANRLGTLGEVDSAISTYRRALEFLGVI